MSFASFMDDLSEAAAKGIRRMADQNYAGKAYSFVHDKLFRPVGKAAGNTVLKAGAAGLEGTANVVDHFRRNKEKYKAFGKKVGQDALNEVNEFGRAAAGIATILDKTHMIERAPYSKSLIGVKATARAKMLALPIALGVGAVGASKDYLTEGRQGRNDGRTYKPTPSMQNPYEISQAIAYSQMGASYADNAGADADLARAISGMR